MNRTSHRAVATVAVRVPLGAAGDLTDGTVRVLERADAVDAVDAVELTGLRPGLNDTVVEVDVQLRLDRNVECATDSLADTVGVRRVDHLAAMEAEPPDTAASASVG